MTMAFALRSWITLAPAYQCLRPFPQLAVHSGVSVNHTTAREESERALAGANPEAGGKAWIAEERGEALGLVGGVTGAKYDSGIAEHFSEGAEVRGEDRQAAEHVFGNDEAKHFSAERGDDYDGGARQSRVQFGLWQGAKKSNVG